MPPEACKVTTAKSVVIMAVCAQFAQRRGKIQPVGRVSVRSDAGLWSVLRYQV
jgi:hypothetical protein